MVRDALKGTRNTDLSLELKRIASDKGFMISGNQGGENCMFHELSEQLDLVKRIKISHEQLSQKVVNYSTREDDEEQRELVSSSVNRCFNFSTLVFLTSVVQGC